MASEKGAWQKSVFYDQSVKVPMIFSWPGHIRENSITNELVGLIDLMPTFAEYGQCLEGCADKEGLSLKALLEQGAPLGRTEIFAESVVLKVPEHAGCMMRTQRFKYNYYLVGRHELYDMENDPNELNNVIDDSSYASTAAMMKARIETFWKPDQQWDRYHACPRVAREKHFHLSANQFVSSDGVIIEAFP
jgi:choline-sulfatase